MSANIWPEWAQGNVLGSYCYTTNHLAPDMQLEVPWLRTAKSPLHPEMGNPAQEGEAKALHWETHGSEESISCWECRESWQTLCDYIVLCCEKWQK